MNTSCLLTLPPYPLTMLVGTSTSQRGGGMKPCLQGKVQEQSDGVREGHLSCYYGRVWTINRGGMKRITLIWHTLSFSSFGILSLSLHFSNSKTLPFLSICSRPAPTATIANSPSFFLQFFTSTHTPLPLIPSQRFSYFLYTRKRLPFCLFYLLQRPKRTV